MNTRQGSERRRVVESKVDGSKISKKIRRDEMLASWQLYAQ